MGRTLFIGEYSSRNVGDGVIQRALASLCAAQGVAGAFRDFSGASGVVDAAPRTPANGSRGGRGLKRALLSSSTFNYLLAGAFYCGRYRAAARRFTVEDYDRVIIGGGNLLMDTFLSFPLRILRIVQQCERARVPVSLFSVGAGARFSPMGARIVRRIVGSPCVQDVICRDLPSFERVAACAAKADRHKVSASADCVLALRPAHAGARADKVGLGVIAPDALRSVTPGHLMSDETSALRWWSDITAALVARGIPPASIEIVSNGSEVDDAFAQRLWEHLRAGYPGVSRAEAVRRPEDLIARISRYRLLFAFRMHASVVAMICGVPVIGFEWDPKVAALFEERGVPEACVRRSHFRDTSPAAVVERGLMASPIELEGVRRRIAIDFRRAAGLPREGA